MNIQLSLAFGIVRICTEVEDREIRFGELKEFLTQREYKEGMINTAIQKARNVPRLVAIQKKAAHMKQTRRPVFAVTWDVGS